MFILLLLAASTWIRMLAYNCPLVWVMRVGFEEGGPVLWDSDDERSWNSKNTRQKLRVATYS